MIFAIGLSLLVAGLVSSKVSIHLNPWQVTKLDYIAYFGLIGPGFLLLLTSFIILCLRYLP